MTEQPHLFSALQLRQVTVRNRIGVSPMCQYSAVADGRAQDWHMVHLGSRAVGGAGLVFFEATAVEDIGRISPADLGIWSDDQVEPLAKIVRFIDQHGAVSCLQLAHAGRKASSKEPWRDGGGPLLPADGGWSTIAPSAIAFSPTFPAPAALDMASIGRVRSAFVAAAKRALAAGFPAIELHAAHGYLLHQFLSPLSNRRDDVYGGSFANRIRLVCEVVDAVRAVWPERLPLLVRLSATDWVDGGWDLEQSVALSKELRTRGVDLVDVSSGGLAHDAKVPAGPGYQTAFAARIRKEAEIATAAVGLITSPEQADHTVRTGQADVVLLAREMLRNPYWPLRAAQRLGQGGPWPKQYLRARA